MDIIEILKDELHIKKSQAEAAVRLIDEGNTIPFIARYRKEATGSLNDEVLRNLDERLRYLRNLEERKEQVIGSIREQEKLTPQLEEKIRRAETLLAVEDLYLPYRPKRRTRAGIAREKGLEPLADCIWEQALTESVMDTAARYVSAEKGVDSSEEALEGAKDILAERISETAENSRAGVVSVSSSISVCQLSVLHAAKVHFFPDSKKQAQAALRIPKSRYFLNFYKKL